MNKNIFFWLFWLFPIVFNAQNLQILNKSNRLLSDNVNVIDVDENFLWAGTYEGIYRINKSLNNPESKSLRKTSVPVLSLLNLKDKILIGFKDKGLYYLDKTNFELSTLFVSELGKKSIEKITKKGSIILIKTDNQNFKLNTDLTLLEETDNLTYEKLIHDWENVKWKNDTLFLNKTPFLNYTDKNINVLAESEKYILLEINQEKMIFITELKALFPFKMDKNYSINQFYFKNNNLLMVCNKGLLVMNIEKQNFKKNKIEAAIVSVNNKIFDATVPYKAFKNSTLKIKFHTRNLGLENELWIGKSFDKLSYTWEKWGIHELEVNQNENPIYYRIKNIRGEQSDIIELNLNIKSDFNLNFINLIIALVLILVYTFAIVWFITKKKNKEISILEEEIILKTKELQSLKREKNGLKNDDKNI